MKKIKKWMKILKVFGSKHPGTGASSVAFYCFMAVVPMLVLFACLMPRNGVSVQSLIRFLQDLVPDAMDEFVAEVVREAYAHADVAMSVSILSLLYVASQFTTAIIYALNVIYDVEDHRGYPKLVLISLLYTSVFMILLSLVVYLIFGRKFLLILNSLVPGVEIPGTVATAITSLILAFLAEFLFAAIYKFLPAGHRSFREQMPGAAFCTCGWYLFSFAFRIYVDHFNRFSKFYGSLATIALFLFWLYCIFYMLLAGGFVNRHVEELGLGFLLGRKWRARQRNGS